MQQKYKYIFHAWTLILTFVNFSVLKNCFYPAKGYSFFACSNYTKSAKFTACIIQLYIVFVYHTKTFCHVCLGIVSYHSRSGRINSKSLSSSELLSSSKYGLATSLSFDGHPELRQAEIRICITRFARLSPLSVTAY